MASFLQAVKSMFQTSSEKVKDAEDKYEGEQLDVDVDGLPLYKEDIISDITQDLERRKTERKPLEQQWILNANFLAGNQYCEINPTRGDVEQVLPVHDWQDREVFNMIAPLIETRIANLKKLTYAMEVKPRTNELDDYSKAEISTSILRRKQHESDFETKKNTMIAWNEMCGNCFVLNWWDKNKGEEYGRETVKVINEEDGTYKECVKSYKEGDVDYGLLTPYEVYPESIFKQGIENQRSIILEQVKTVDDIYDLYGITVNGGTVETFELTPVASGGGFGWENTVMQMGHRTTENAVKVITKFERPSRKHPDGLMVIIVDGDKLVYYGGLPYKRIPMIQVVCREVAGQFFGKSVIEDLIPRQRAYNGLVNRIHEYGKRAAVQAHYVEEGSVDMDELEELGSAPGASIEYRVGSNPPTPIPNGNLPGELMTERYNLVRDMEYVAGVSQLTTSGSTPAGVTSGKAIEAIKATDDTRLSLTGDHIRNAVRDLAKIWLEIYKEYATTYRVVQTVGGNDIGNALVWCNNDINSYDIEFTVENELLFTEEAQQEKFLQAYQMGLFADENGRIPERMKQRAIEGMRIHNYTEIMNLNSLQIQAAKRENAFFEEGILPEISEFDDHNIHIEEHLRYRLQMQFKVMQLRNPELAKMFEEHIKQHQRVVEQKQQAMMQQAMIQGGKQNG